MSISQETTIHPTAIVEDSAQIDSGVIIGPYAYVGHNTKIGKGTKLQHHACVEANTSLGKNNEIFPFAIIGGKTHDLKHKGGNPGTKIGDSNTFREYVTIHAATDEGDFTTLGNNNVILAYSHVAHDCHIADNLIMSSNSALAGHVNVENNVTIAWNVGVHQFCSLGAFAMLGGCSKIVQSVLPYMLVDGNPAEVRTYNKIGLERNGFTPEQIEGAKFIFQTLYRKGLNRTQGLEALKESQDKHPELIKAILEFTENETGRGLV